jgi:hypothetical protein
MSRKSSSQSSKTSVRRGTPKHSIRSDTKRQRRAATVQPNVEGNRRAALTLAKLKA